MAPRNCRFLSLVVVERVLKKGQRKSVSESAGPNWGAEESAEKSASGFLRL